jgi:anthranilate synthase component 1
VSAPAIDAGTILPLARRIAGAADPLALYSASSDGRARADTLLLESADTTTGAGDRSILVVGASARLTCRGRSVEMRALSSNGQTLVEWVRGGVLALAPGSCRLSAVSGSDGVTDASRAGLVLTYAEPDARATDERTRLLAPSPLDALRLVVRGPKLTSAPLEPSHFAAGIIAYDLLEVYEQLPEPAQADDEPLYEMWVPDRFIVIDHRRQATTVVACAYGGEGSGARYHDAMQAVERLARRVEEALGEPGRAAGAASGAASGSTAGGPPPRFQDAALSPRQPNQTSARDTGAPPAEPDLELDDDAYAAIVARLQRRIVAGDVFQIVPSRGFRLPCSDPLAAYARLRATNPSPYMFYVRAAASTLLGTSPETCVKVYASERLGERDALRVRLKPIAGTAARGLRADGSLDADLDTRREAALRLDTKEAAEHLMLVDLARNDVARVSRPGSREVTKLLTVERYSRVMHLVSEVEGTLDAGLDALHAYAASLNMGTLVGAPMVRAAQLLRGAEPRRRGAYGGAVGFFTAAGEMDTAIVIRSAVVRAGVAEVRAGAGVVLDSDPRSEALETRRKAEAVLRALREAESVRDRGSDITQPEPAHV